MVGLYASPYNLGGFYERSKWLHTCRITGSTSYYRGSYTGCYGLSLASSLVTGIINLPLNYEGLFGEVSMKTLKTQLEAVKSQLQSQQNAAEAYSNWKESKTPSREELNRLFEERERERSPEPKGSSKGDRALKAYYGL